MYFQPLCVDTMQYDWERAREQFWVSSAVPSVNADDVSVVENGSFDVQHQLAGDNTGEAIQEQQGSTQVVGREGLNEAQLGQEEDLYF